MDKLKLRNLVGEIRSDLLAIENGEFLRDEAVDELAVALKRIDKKLSKLNDELR
jgi:hypothetical protein